MFKEPAYWMYYFWSKNKRARKDKAVISNATWTMAILWFLNLMALHLLFEAWGWDMLTGWFSSLTDKVEWSRFNPVAYLFARFFGLSMVWWSIPIAEIVSVILSTLLLRRIYRLKVKPLED